MIVALILLSYAALVAVVGPCVLARASWPDRAPRLGIVAWQSMSAAVIGAVVLAGLALAVPTVRISAGLADLLRACVMALRAQYATPGGAAAGATGAVIALAVLGRCGYCVARAVFAAARGRSRHREILTLTGRSRPEMGAFELGETAPAVYCLPGRRSRIVVTSGALDVLDDDQLAAALAHERAHLKQRHDLVIAWACGLAHAFPRLTLFTRGLIECRRLIELLADDAAIRTSDRLTLAEALLNLAGARTPTAALGAGGDAAARVERLIAPHRPLSRTRRWAGWCTLLTVFAAPLIAIATPAIAATHMNYCPTATRTHATT